MTDPLKHAEGYLEIADMDPDMYRTLEWLIAEVKELRNGRSTQRFVMTRQRELIKGLQDQLREKGHHD
jgi:hypothetical protein